MENQNSQQPQQPQIPQQPVVHTPTENIVDNTLARVSQMQELGQIQLPKDYSAANALRAAWLILQEVKNRDNVPALTCCSRESIAYALLNMVVQGLNPMKRQCSFIVYGNKLTLQREYQGSVAVARRYGLKNVTANAIFKGDVFKYEVDAETGRKRIVAHEQSFENLGGEVVGAYAIIEMEDGRKDVEVMGMNQIRMAWNQGATKGTSPAHKNFPDQMACKTVIGRAMKPIINSSDDAALFEDETPAQDQTAADVSYKIEANANRKEVGFDSESGEVLESQPKQLSASEAVPFPTQAFSAPVEQAQPVMHQQAAPQQVNGAKVPF